MAARGDQHAHAAGEGQPAGYGGPGLPGAARLDGQALSGSVMVQTPAALAIDAVAATRTVVM